MEDSFELLIEFDRVARTPIEHSLYQTPAHGARGVKDIDSMLYCLHNHLQGLCALHAANLL